MKRVGVQVWRIVKNSQRKSALINVQVDAWVPSPVTAATINVLLDVQGQENMTVWYESYLTYGH